MNFRCSRGELKRPRSRPVSRVLEVRSRSYRRIPDAGWVDGGTDVESEYMDVNLVVAEDT